MSDDRLLRAAADVLAFLEDRDIQSCLIGGLAVLRWGEQRATRDVDISVLSPYGEEAQVLDLLLERYQTRRADARAFALTSRVLLLRSAEGVEIDVALAAFPFEKETLDRSTPWTALPGLSLRTCSAEDLLVYKLVAARPRDLLDVESIVQRQQGKLDVERIRHWGGEFAELKEDPDLLRPFENALQRLKP